MLLCSTVCWCLPAAAQSRHVKQREKELANKAEDRESDEAAQHAEAKARHMSIQNKKTLKEMKRYQKQSKNYNTNRRPLFRKRR